MNWPQKASDDVQIHMVSGPNSNVEIIGFFSHFVLKLKRKNIQVNKSLPLSSNQGFCEVISESISEEV